MRSGAPWYDVLSLPALLRHARVTYGIAIRERLDAAGHDDIPKNGLYVIGGMARDERDVPLAQLIRELRISKQAAGQLVDTLVVRGYLERAVDPTDRRRLTLALTPKGLAAAAIQGEAIAAIDAELAKAIGSQGTSLLRSALATLIDIGHNAAETTAGLA